MTLLMMGCRERTLVDMSKEPLLILQIGAKSTDKIFEARLHYACLITNLSI